MNPITFNFTGAIQNYTVTVSGTYDISAFGAQGGGQGAYTGGLGAQTGGVFSLTAGEQIQVVTGGQGASGTGAGGGGGGSFVLGSTNGGQTYSLLLAAGGGGGAGNTASGSGGLAAATGANGTGLGGAGGTNAGGGGGGGGAGFLGPGGNGITANGYNGGVGASSYTSFGTGGSYQAFTGGNGGFGGGGGAGVPGGGGGGGYTGGGGGNYGNSTDNGFGGTSFNAGTPNAAETAAGVRSGNGSATIRLTAANPAPPANNAPCYVSGTCIRVLRDLTIQNVPVEHLRVGDLALTVAGKPSPIRWIGSRGYRGLTAPQADRPVRIQVGALADGVPARDLLVSPDHCLWLDGLLVAAGHLVNGTSITRGEPVADLTYWHVELDSHDLLLAESTPAESFLAFPGVRAGFDGVQALDAGAAPVPYARRTELGPELAALRGRLARRALSSSDAADLGPVRAWLDRCVVAADGLLHVGGWAQDTARPDTSVCLDMMVDGAVVAFAVASEYRADLVTAGVGDGRVGFDLGLDVQLTPGVPHVVEVRRSADGALVCAKQVDAAGVWTALLAA